MINRIVRMSFHQDRTEDFLQIFDGAKAKIRQMQGCEYLSLHRDHHHTNVYYTLSHWASQDALDAYRNSELFKATWADTKILFDGKPQAFSLELKDELM